MSLALDAFYDDRAPLYEFERAEVRNSSRRRSLDCGHEIDSREPYLYFVAKIPCLTGLVQRRDCDVCMRRDDAY